MALTARLGAWRAAAPAGPTCSATGAPAQDTAVLGRPPASRQPSAAGLPAVEAVQTPLPLAARAETTVLGLLAAAAAARAEQ